VASELNQFLSDEALRAAMSGVLLFTGLPPQQTPVVSILGLIALLSEGFFLPEGGMGKIPEALSQALKLNGGEIWLNSKIDKIIVKNGRVRGAAVAGQGLIEAEAVISTVSGMVTFSSLLPPEAVPAALRRKVRQAPLSHKALAIQLGLSNPMDGCSHANSILPLMDEQTDVFRPYEDEVKWPIYFVPTVTMPELAPPGGSIIEMFPPISQDRPIHEWDEAKKEKAVAAAVKALARLHPLDIVVTRVLSPRDYQERLHLYQGAVYGLSPVADPGAQFPYRPPIPGLYQAGQTTYPGYGIAPAAMSGILAAETLMTGLQKKE
jgi:phytoene desaturase